MLFFHLTTWSVFPFAFRNINPNFSIAYQALHNLIAIVLTSTLPIYFSFLHSLEPHGFPLASQRCQGLWTNICLICSSSLFLCLTTSFSFFGFCLNVFTSLTINVYPLALLHYSLKVPCFLHGTYYNFLLFFLLKNICLFHWNVSLRSETLTCHIHSCIPVLQCLAYS